MPKQNYNNTRSLKNNQVDKSTTTVLSGIFQIQYKSEKEGQTADSGESDVDEENDPLLLDLEETEESDTSVLSRIPKEKKVQIKDDRGKIHNCTGKFPMTQIFWKVTMKVSKGWLRSAPVYAIRTDENVQKQKLVMIFLTDCLKGCVKMDIASNAVKACFEAFCRLTDKESNLSFTNLEETLKKYVEHEHSQGCCLKNVGASKEQFCQMDHSSYIKDMLKTDLCTMVLRAASHPALSKTASALLPNTFIQFLHKLELKENKNKDTDNTDLERPSALQLADEMANQRPWEFAFRDIIYAKLKLQGTEATLFAYENAGYLPKTPQREKDAMYIYEVLKVDARKDGHTYINFKRLQSYYYFKNLGYQISGEERWRKAFEYLDRNKITKRESFNGEMNIFLHYNWQAEVDIGNGLELILLRHREDPLKWIIDYRSPDFEKICNDPDQLKALHLIASSPITVLSGKGGCGKTTVITLLLKHLYDRMERKIREARQEELDHQEETDVKAGNAKNPDYACSQENVSLCQYRNYNADTQSPLKPSNASCVTSSQNPINNSSHCLAVSVKDIAVSEGSSANLSADFDSAGDTVVPKMDPLATHSRYSQSLAQDLNTSLALSAQIPPHSSQTDIKGKKRWTQQSPSQATKEEKHRREVISDLIKIVKLTKDVDHPLLQEYKKQILLTAPTGKAARLLGVKAGLPSATLHSVIMSWRMYRKTAYNSEKETKSWNYSAVEVLVVDECSLVSVRLFACVMNILLKKANLKKIVLLGDMRQLPSIEAGDFLTDVFKAFVRLGNERLYLSVELTSNHRSESTLIVQNAGKISNQVMPTFSKEQRFHLVQISEDGDDNERDEAIRHLLNNVEDVSSQVDSQFISFRNAHCRAVNELCCQHYNQHSMKTPAAGGREGSNDFRIGDKICLGKNAFVSNFRQLMLTKYLDLDSELQEAVSEAVSRHEKLNQDKTSSQGNLNRSTIDAQRALSLFESDDDVFDRTVNKMRERDRQAEEAKSERAKQAFKRSGGQQTARRSSRKTVESFLGEDREKLCNGEVFFIMDDIQDFDQRGANDTIQQPVRYLVLSDKDPYIPRVVCVPIQVLRKECKMKHSWARTIHTFQGSESESVVYILGKAIPQNWQHVYTAVTRGKKSVFIIGSWNELHKAVLRKEYPRRSRLRHRLEEMIKSNKNNFLHSFNTDIGNVMEAPNVEEMDSNDSWVYKVSLDLDLEDPIKDEDTTDVKSPVNNTAADTNFMDALKVNTRAANDASSDSINNLNQETQQHRHTQNDFNVYSSFEDNEEMYSSDEELLAFQISNSDFTTLCGPETSTTSPLHLGTENNSSRTFTKESTNTSSPVESSMHSHNQTVLLHSPSVANLWDNTVGLVTPPRPSRPDPVYGTDCEQEMLLPSKSSCGYSPKVRRTDSPSHTPFRNSFARLLKLEEETSNIEGSYSHRKKSTRKNLSEL